MRNPYKAVTKAATQAAPIKGWNARDPLSDMKPEEAIVLDNWFPETDKVILRKGYSAHVTGFDSIIETLLEYHSATSSKLFACSGDSIYDVTTAGVVGAASVSGLTNARWQPTNFGNAGSQWLIIANGADNVRSYNGTAWATPSITGVTSSTLIHVNAFKSRLFFTQADKLSVWYLPVNSIAGAASELDFSPYCKLGGYMMAMATWSFDGYSSIDDYAMFITSEGEVLMYQGTDPSSASTWALKGIFHVGKPIGRRCFIKLGGELVIITEDGFLPMSRFVRTDQISPQYAVSDKIRRAVTDAVLVGSGYFGWEPKFYPKGHFVIINVPTVPNVTSVQFVMNTITGAWCRFTNIPANCFGILNGNLYTGGIPTTSTPWGASWRAAWTSKPAVWKLDTGYTDNSGVRTGIAETAFSYFGNMGQTKRFTMLRPLIDSLGAVTASLKINTDFFRQAADTSPSFSGSSGPLWGSSWFSSWAAPTQVFKSWQTATGVGYCASTYMKIASDSADLAWIANNFIYEPGGPL